MPIFSRRWTNSKNFSWRYWSSAFDRRASYLPPMDRLFFLFWPLISFWLLVKFIVCFTISRDNQAVSRAYISAYFFRSSPSTLGEALPRSRNEHWLDCHSSCSGHYFLHFIIHDSEGICESVYNGRKYVSCFFWCYSSRCRAGSSGYWHNNFIHPRTIKNQSVWPSEVGSEKSLVVKHAALLTNSKNSEMNFIRASRRRKFLAFTERLSCYIINYQLWNCYDPTENTD